MKINKIQLRKLLKEENGLYKGYTLRYNTDFEYNHDIKGNFDKFYYYTSNYFALCIKDTTNSNFDNVIMHIWFNDIKSIYKYDTGVVIYLKGKNELFISKLSLI